MNRRRSPTSAKVKAMTAHITGAVVVGAGFEGTALAEHILEAGYPVWMATRKTAEELTPEVGAAAPGAIAINLSDIPALPAGAAVLLAIPLSTMRDIDPSHLTGRIVIDVMNFWPRLDSATDFAEAPRDSSLVTQSHFADSGVVKTMNHMAYSDIAFDSRPRTATYRRAQAVAGNDADARLAAARFVDSLGFTPVDAGPLENGRLFGPGTALFNGGWRTADQIARIIEKQTGYRGSFDS